MKFSTTRYLNDMIATTLGSAVLIFLGKALVLVGIDPNTMSGSQISEHILTNPEFPVYQQLISLAVFVTASLWPVLRITQWKSEVAFVLAYIYLIIAVTVGLFFPASYLIWTAYISLPLLSYLIWFSLLPKHKRQNAN